LESSWPDPDLVPFRLEADIKNGVETIVDPDLLADVIGRESVTFVGIHHRIIDYGQLSCQCTFSGVTMSVPSIPLVEDTIGEENSLYVVGKRIRKLNG
jgi:hypothetical protein